MPAQSALKGHSPPRNDGPNWAAALEAALTAARGIDLNHGTYAAHVAGCVCRECRGTPSESVWPGTADASSVQLHIFGT
jgi:hypothetical protein